MNLLLSQSSAGFRPGFPVCPGFLFGLVSTVSLTETCIHCHFQSLLPLLVFHCSVSPINFFYLYLLFSVCQALLKKKKMFEKVTVSFHYPFLLFNFFVPSSRSCQYSFSSLACPSIPFQRSLWPPASRRVLWEAPGPRRCLC